jgi:hypothetical protein
MYRALDYYESLSTAAAHPTVGGIYWTCFQFAYNGPVVNRVHLDGRTSERIDVAKFDPNSERPDANDNTRSNEFIAQQKFKHRPVVVLSPPGSHYSPTMDARWHAGQHVLVVPIYSVWSKTPPGYDVPAEFLLKAIRYEYDSAFFLPGSKAFDRVAGIARFEYAQSMHASWLVRGRPAVKLTDVALQFIQEWFIHYLTETLSPEFLKDLIAYRELLAAEGVVDVHHKYFPAGLYED